MHDGELARNIRRGRGGRPYRRFKARVFAEAQRTNAPCCLCGGPLDWELTRLYPRHRGASSLEHLEALALGGAPLDPRNAGVSHLGCNAGRGIKPIAMVTVEITSRRW